MGWASRVLTCVVGMSMGFAAEIASADSGLLKMLPRDSNAVMAVDVQSLLNSPLGVERKWQSHLISNYAERPLAVPAHARHVVVGSVVTPGTLDPILQVALIDLGVPANLEKIARAQNGWVEEIAGRPAARTAAGVLYVQVNDAVLASMAPAQRQLAARLIGSGATAGGLNDYLTAAVAQLGQNEVVIALDLADAFSPPQIGHAIAFGAMPSLDAYDGDLAKLGPALASVRGVKLSIDVEKDIACVATVDFANAPMVPDAMLEPFCLDVLREAGLFDPQLENWTFRREGNQIVGTGPIDLALFGTLTSMFSPAAVETQVADAAGTTQPPANADANAGANAGAKSPAEASQAYYRSVAMMLDSAHRTASPTQSAAWLTAQSRRIQQLPTLDVDPELLAWGNEVSQAFLEAGAALGIGQTKAMSAAQGVGSPTASASSSQSGYSNQDSAESRAAFRNAQMARRSAAQAQRAEASRQALAAFEGVLAARGEVRAKMAQKYQVEF